MFGKKKQQSEATAEEQVTAVTGADRKGYTPSKGAPTPRRKDAQKARQRPIIASTVAMTKEEKKALKAENRARSNEAYQKQQHAMRTGDEKNMPISHRGPVRRWTRDYIDASAPFAQWFMPIALLMLPTLFLANRFPTVSYWATITIYVLFVVMLVQLFFIVRKGKKLATYRFGADQIPSGLSFQMVGRGMYMPNWRLPKPQVKRGEFPEGATSEDLRKAKAAEKAAKAK